MGNIDNLRIGQLQEEKVFSLIVNKYNDTILLPLDDANFIGRFVDLIKWLDGYEVESQKKENEIKKRFEGRELIADDDNGNSVIDMEMLNALNDFHREIYNAMFDRIEMLFGKDSLKKYFRMFYEITPDYIPDEDALADFLEEISPVINTLYDTKVEYKRKRREKFDKYKKVYHK